MVLRRWNSFTPRLPNRESPIRGGGYFLVWKGKGIVIDPGFDFLNNFGEHGFSIKDIDAVVITHAHTDHTADLETLLCLKFEQISRKLDNSKLDLFMNRGALNKFIGWISSQRGIGRIVSLNIGDSINLEEYSLVLKATEAKHSEVIGDHCIGLIFELSEGREKVLSLGISSDTYWTNKIERQYLGCKLICVHLGSVFENDFNEEEMLKSRARPYPQHLGLIGTIKMVKAINPDLCVISEFGEELGRERCIVAKSLDRAYDKEKRCLTGDIGLRIRLPDLAVHCNICSDYRDKLMIAESTVPSSNATVYTCSSHKPQEVLDYFFMLSE